MEAEPKPRATRGPSLAKRRAILEAATQLFLAEGYRDASMDQVAARAGVSKQTVYKHFESKEQLLGAFLEEVATRAAGFIDSAVPALLEARHLESELAELARRYLATVMQPHVLQVRRLVIGEAACVPQLAREYSERVPERTLAALARAFAHLAGRGLLRVDDPPLAAAHFAFLVLGMPLDRAMFRGADHGLDEQDLERLAEAGARVFLAAYGAK